MLVLLLTSQNEGELLAANIAHHLEYGIDHVGVADNMSTDATQAVVASFGSAASSIVFDDFHQRQSIRMQLFNAVNARHSVDWVGVSDTDEFWYAEGATMRSLLADTPNDVVAVNFDAKLFLPTALDHERGGAFAQREHRTASNDSPLHTSYSEGKTWYRAAWLKEISHEHHGRDVPHERYRHDVAAVLHYMVGDEDQFVQKVTRLIAWAPEPERKGLFKKRAPDPRTLELPKWSAWFKKEWWAVYCNGGEAAVRDYYRNHYTLSLTAVAKHLANGELAVDDAFAKYSAARAWSGCL